MNINDIVRVAVGDRALVNQAPAGLGPSGFDPSRIRIMEWATDHGQARLTYPDYLTTEDLNELEQLFALTIKIGRRRASAIETRSAETGTGSVHESAIGDSRDAQPPTKEPTHD